MNFNYKNPIAEGFLDTSKEIDRLVYECYLRYLEKYKEVPRWVVFERDYHGQKKEVKIHFSHFGSYTDDIDLSILNLLADDIPEGAGKMRWSMRFTDTYRTKEVGLSSAIAGL